MRTFFTRSLLVLFLSFTGLVFLAQTPKPAAKSKAKKHPETFIITKSDFDKLFSYKLNSVVKMKSNPYLNGSKVLLNSTTGDNKQLKLKLNYFPKSVLIVQVNGKDSQQLFVMSEDNSVFYRNITEDDKYKMVKCEKDEIISE